MKSAAELKRIQREKKRKEGFILKQLWVKPESWKKIQKFIKSLKE